MGIGEIQITLPRAGRLQGNPDFSEICRSTRRGPGKSRSSARLPGWIQRSADLPDFCLSACRKSRFPEIYLEESREILVFEMCSSSGRDPVKSRLSRCLFQLHGEVRDIKIFLTYYQEGSGKSRCFQILVCLGCSCMCFAFFVLLICIRWHWFCTCLVFCIFGQFMNIFENIRNNFVYVLLVGMLGISVFSKEFFLLMTDPKFHKG
jgi:hypothetical protein